MKLVGVGGASYSGSLTGTLYAGYSGTGTLTISGGGYVADSVAYIGYNSGSTGTVTVTGGGSEWINSGALYVGSSGTGTLTISSGALVTATTLSIGSGSYLYLNGGYLALSSTDSTSDYGTLYSLISDGNVYVIEGTSSILLTTDNYASYVTLTYYSDVTTCDALDAYDLSGSYTVLTTAVPEPAAYALFGGIGAMGLVLYRRRAK